jgi:two-component system, NtrC family, nitrogen regulation sensor histidine kinase NtrY
VLEDHGGKIELNDAADIRPGARGAWMRLRFAVSGHAPKPDIKEPASEPKQETKDLEATKDPEKTKDSEKTKDPENAKGVDGTKDLASGTVEPTDATNNETKIKAATGS